MSVKTSRAVNELFDTLLGVSFVSRIASSAIYTATVVVIVIVLLAMFVYRESDNLIQKSLRLLFWAGVFTGVLFMLRERKLTTDVAKAHESAGTRELFEDAQQSNGITRGSREPVDNSQGYAYGGDDDEVDVHIMDPHTRTPMASPPINTTQQSSTQQSSTQQSSTQQGSTQQGSTESREVTGGRISDAQLAAVANRRGYAIIKVAN